MSAVTTRLGSENMLRPVINREIVTLGRCAGSDCQDTGCALLIGTLGTLRRGNDDSALLQQGRNPGRRLDIFVGLAGMF
jgi:hypothetical protein